MNEIPESPDGWGQPPMSRRSYLQLAGVLAGAAGAGATSAGAQAAGTTGYGIVGYGGGAYTSPAVGPASVPVSGPAPSVSADSATVTRGQRVAIDVLANDAVPDGSLARGSVAVATPPSHGTTTVEADGTVEYAHDGSDPAGDSFTYAVTDGDGVTSGEAVVSVTVEPVAQAPYVAHDLSRIQAEDFDVGGEGVAYHDTSSGDKGGTYRDTGVDIESTSDAGGGYNVGWINRGEWWEYTVSVPAAGAYDLRARVAGRSESSFDVAVDGSQVTTVDVPDTGGWQEWTTVEADTVTISRGTHTIRLTANGNEWNLDWVGFEETQAAYVDHDVARIQAEDFDTGGEGVAYHDTSTGNKGTAYRDTDVDIEVTGDDTGEYNVGWINRGEWWEYTVFVPAAGEYDLRARVAGRSETTLDVAVDGSQVATIDVPDTGGWQVWTTVEAGTVRLPAGVHTVRLTATGNEWNLGWVGFE